MAERDESQIGLIQLRAGPSLYIEDPEGNVVELKGPPEE